MTREELKPGQLLFIDKNAINSKRQTRQIVDLPEDGTPVELLFLGGEYIRFHWSGELNAHLEFSALPNLPMEGNGRISICNGDIAVMGLRVPADGDGSKSVDIKKETAGPITISANKGEIHVRLRISRLDPIPRKPTTLLAEALYPERDHYHSTK